MSGRGGLRGRLAVCRGCLGVLVVLAPIVVGDGLAGEDSARNEVKERFEFGKYDHMMWTLNNTGVAVTKVDFSRGTMRLFVPPGPEERPIMGLESRFGLEGDFDISVDYSIRSLPRPEKEWTNLSIFILGRDGMAAITRTNDAKSGQGYSLWFQPPEGSQGKGLAKIEPTGDMAGTLRLARLGRELRYYASSRGKAPQQIGMIDFGDHPIDLLALQVLAPALGSPIDVEYDNITVKADRIGRRVSIPQNGIASRLWLLSGLSIILLVLLGWWSLRRRR